MHLRASVIHHLLSAHWTLVFLCVIHHFANSYVHSYPANTGDNADSRVVKLRWIAKRLAHSHQQPYAQEQALTEETLDLIKSLTASIGTAHNSAVKRVNQPEVVINPDRRSTRLDVLRRVYRQVTGDPLANFKSKYTNLRSAMVPFLDTLIQRFIPGSNSVLLNVALIPTVLTLNDPAFNSGNVDIITKKYFIVDETFRLVLTQGQGFVQPAYRQWFNTQVPDLTYKMNTAAYASLSLPFHEDPSGVSLVSVGIGGVNTGVHADMNYDTLMKLYNLVNFLNSGQVKTT